MKNALLYTILCILSSLFCTANIEALRSPENQVFQFSYEDSFTYDTNLKVNTAAYLWIPENCTRLKGLLILCRNVTEHTLVGHSAIRKICIDNNLGILWCVPSFFSTQNKDPVKSVKYLQQLLDHLAEQTGYSELSTVPWLPIGESGHLLMVDQLLDGAPDRCIAGIYVKNAHYFCKNRTTPILVAVGTAQEWDQDKIDIRKHWKDISFYESIIKEHKINPKWPISLLIDGGSGHFDCPEWMAVYFADYIDAVAKIRLSVDSDKLLPINYNAGYVTGLPLPNKTPISAHQYVNTSNIDKSLPWFFNKSLAQQAYSAANINWNAETQLPAYTDSSGNPALMLFRNSTFLDKIPKNFINAGEKLNIPKNKPTVEWICGPIVPIGNANFKIALDRTWLNSPICVALRNEGTDTIRYIAEPGYINLKINTEGMQQHISFDTLPTYVDGIGPISLHAHSDSNMPVQFFIVAGPAIIKNNQVIFTPIPPRSHYPIKVTISAWQWGRSIEPKVQTAKIINQSFYITTDHNFLN